MSGAMSLNAKIRNIAKEKRLPAQVVLQNYMFERFMYRLSLSEYKDKFVIKGGMLVASIVGLDNRATMDLDTTLRGLPLEPEKIRKAITEISEITTEDNIKYEIRAVEPIREDDVYGGYRVSINAIFDTINTPLSIDVTTGDVITPHADKHDFSEIFDDGTYCLLAYNNETLLAEKVETILRHSVFNTRPRDFYDAYIIASTKKYEKTLFLEALRATSEHRGTSQQIADTKGILLNISESIELKTMWEKYCKDFAYAKNISFEDIIEAIRNLLQ